MQQRRRLPASLIWLVTVLAMWMVTTALLAVLVAATFARTPVSAVISQSVLSAAFACVIVGGPATAVALRVRCSRGCGRAAVSGLAAGALIMLFAWSYLEASGAPISGAWSAVGPVFVIAAAEIALAFALRGRRATAVEPDREPDASQPEAS